MKRREDPERDPASEERDDWAENAPATPAVKERPILFSGPMVRAILSSTKTQTRRIVKLTDSGRVKATGSARNWHLEDPNAVLACSYGQPGDRLWVREAFSLCESTRDDGNRAPLYRATSITGTEVKWKPSIHMPRWASRITLEITAVRVERLQEISWHDAKREGVRMQDCEVGPPTSFTIDYIGGYRRLWESINGPGSWDANPWVWVVEFKRTTP